MIFADGTMWRRPAAASTGASRSMETAGCEQTGSEHMCLVGSVCVVRVRVMWQTLACCGSDRLAVDVAILGYCWGIGLGFRTKWQDFEGAVFDKIL